MIVEFVHWPGKQTEMTKAEFELLGPRKKLFKIISEKDDPLTVKQQMISNNIGKKEKLAPASTKRSGEKK